MRSRWIFLLDVTSKSFQKLFHSFEEMIGLRFKSSAVEYVDPEALWLVCVKEVRQPADYVSASSSRHWRPVSRGACHCSLRGTKFAFLILSARCRRWNAVLLEDLSTWSQEFLASL